MKIVIKLNLLFASLTLAHTAMACPTVASLPDFNCDGEARIVVLGDSLVFGTGDTINNNAGGYVLRTQARFPGALVSNFGVPGLKTLDLLKNIRKAFAGDGDSNLHESLIKADLVVLDLGRNDRWLFGPPSATLRNLKRISSLIKQKVKESVISAPLVVTAVLMYPNRGAQGPWVKELDELIIKSHSVSAPADLRFDQVSKRLLSSDQIHPTSKGYKALADVFIKYLLKQYPIHASTSR